MKISAKKLNEKHLAGVGNSFYGEMMQLAENLEIENEKLRNALRIKGLMVASAKMLVISFLCMSAAEREKVLSAELPFFPPR